VSKQFTIAEIAKHLNADFIGDQHFVVSGIADLNQASPDEISFLSNPKFKASLADSKAGVLLLSAELVSLWSKHAIVVKNPYVAYAKVAQLFDTTPNYASEISESAVVADSAEIGKNVAIAANAVIGEHAIIEDGVQIGPGTVVGRGSHIKAQSRLWANVTVYHDIEIGKDCIIHSGTVIGSDGFGYANEGGQWVKIPQVGRVIIGDRVEIGANCAIDRGAINDTVIEDGVILDNMIHIAHNVKLGEGCAMAAFSGIAGSTELGKGVTISGSVAILGHLNIPDGTHITARSFVNKSVPEPGIYSSGTTLQTNKDWKKSLIRYRQLDDMAKKLKQLEKQMNQLQQGNDND
jgi:UDP-3-O-[3-hydroxymyristoyl] glucosamine N-acyltransferase